MLKIYLFFHLAGYFSCDLFTLNSLFYVVFPLWCVFITLMSLCWKEENTTTWISLSHLKVTTINTFINIFFVFFHTHLCHGDSVKIVLFR